MTARDPGPRATFTARHAYELRARFDGSLARGASGGVKSWLGPMLERCASGIIGAGPAPFGVSEMRVRGAPRTPSGAPHASTSFAALGDMFLLRAIDAALGRLAPFAATVLAAHYGPPPQGAEGLEPRDLVGAMLVVSGKTAEALKTIQVRAMKEASGPDDGVALSPLKMLTRYRVEAEEAVAEAEQAYAEARGVSTPKAGDLDKDH